MANRFWPSAQSVLPIVPRRVHPVDPSPSLTRPLQVPFFRLAEHRVPTRWSLYRPLLRGLRGIVRPGDTASTGRPVYDAQQSHTIDVLRRRWKKARSLTSPSMTRSFLEKEYALLDRVEEALDGNQSIVHQLQHEETSLSISTKPKSPHLSRSTTAGKPSHPPRLSPHPIRATLFNPPLPRLKPQPLRISMIINSRLRAREGRMRKQGEEMTAVALMKAEEGFWKDVGMKAETGLVGGWAIEHRNHLSSLQSSFLLDAARAETPIDDGLRDRCKDAGKRRERQLRERALRRRSGKMRRDGLGRGGQVCAI